MKNQDNRSILDAKLQRRLRRSMTDAERRLWQHLRMRQLGGCKFRRQHPLGNYIVDFACLARKVVVELDGGQHADQRQQDEARTAALASSGFEVLRFWNHEVFGDLDSVLMEIYRVLAERGDMGG